MMSLTTWWTSTGASATASPTSSVTRGERLERVSNALLDQIEPGHHVLDLGCGQARLALLVPATCTYVGVDSSREMLFV